MIELTRRQLGIGALAGSLGALAPAAAAAASGAKKPQVDFTNDGVPLAPADFAALLARLAAAPGVEADEYSRGGAVAALEAWFANALGKEACVFMPSGTLANHLAVRALAGTRARVLVQRDSHLYCDSGDGTQQLSRLNLVPLAPGRADLTLEDVDAELALAAGGRVPAPVGAISIESPVRRLHFAAVDPAAVEHISRRAREQGVGMHLDGARLYVWAAYAGRTPAELAAPFDTVYVSLWKCFNAGGGAVLAGPKALLENMYHVRRQFGGALWNAWPYALVARHYAEGYLDRLREAVRVSEALIAALAGEPRFAVERVERGTSLFRLVLRDGDATKFRERLAARGIVIAPPDATGVWLKVNESLRGQDPVRLAGSFHDALAL